LGRVCVDVCYIVNPLKPQSNGPLYSNTVIGTLVVDGRAVTFGTARSGLGAPCMAAAPPSPLHAVSNVTARPSTARVPTSLFIYNCLSLPSKWLTLCNLATLRENGCSYRRATFKIVGQQLWHHDMKFNQLAAPYNRARGARFAMTDTFRDLL